MQNSAVSPAQVFYRRLISSVAFISDTFSSFGARSHQRFIIVNLCQHHIITVDVLGEEQTWRNNVQFLVIQPSNRAKTVGNDVYARYDP